MSQRQHRPRRRRWPRVCRAVRPGPRRTCQRGAAIAGLLLYLYVAEPLISHIAALHSWTAYLPGVAADGLTQASQAGVRLLPPWQGGLVLTAWAIAFAATGTVFTARRDIT
ncbi:MAG TPA: hypothetical protein VIV12_01695 [Streptosporangiaceae bacterium]